MFGILIHLFNKYLSDSYCVSDSVDTNVSQLDMVLVSCWAGEKDHNQAITHVIGAGLGKGPCCGARCTGTWSKLKIQGEKGCGVSDSYCH